MKKTPVKPKVKKVKAWQELRIIIGTQAYKPNDPWAEGSDDYAERVGRIEFRSGRTPRIQFLDIGNNETIANFDLSRCKFFLANRYSTYRIPQEITHMTTKSRLASLAQSDKK